VRLPVIYRTSLSCTMLKDDPWPQIADVRTWACPQPSSACVGSDDAGDALAQGGAPRCPARCPLRCWMPQQGLGLPRRWTAGWIGGWSVTSRLPTWPAVVCRLVGTRAALGALRDGDTVSRCRWPPHQGTTTPTQ